MREQEQAKYEKIWKFPQYRKHAPGEFLVPEAVNKMGMEQGASVIDFGCGTGRAAQYFHNLGFYVIGVDFASNCLDPDTHFRFEQKCLWEPMNLNADYGFCTDVMEHIPPAFVDRTLDEIAKSVNKACYFQIATSRDGMGRLIGERLHLTVEQPQWWYNKLQEFFPDVLNIRTNNKYIAVGFK